MRRIVLALVTAGSAFAFASPAIARDGCGGGFHRNYSGRCVSNRGPGYVAPGPSVRLVIGQHYPGRGYWDGRRYYEHRYRWHRGWRYR